MQAENTPYVWIMIITSFYVTANPSRVWVMSTAWFYINNKWPPALRIPSCFATWGKMFCSKNWQGKWHDWGPDKKTGRINCSLNDLRPYEHKRSNSDKPAFSYPSRTCLPAFFSELLLVWRSPKSASAFSLCQINSPRVSLPCQVLNHCFQWHHGLSCLPPSPRSLWYHQEEKKKACGSWRIN